MARVIVFLVVIGIMIYALIDCLRTPEQEVKALPKPVWLLAIVVVPVAGGVLWILTGRADSGPVLPSRRPRYLAPDDDPEFLRSLDVPRKKSDPSDDSPDQSDQSPE